MKKTTTPGVVWDLEQILPIKDFDALYSEVDALLPQYTAWLKKFSPDMPTSVLQDYYTWHNEVEEKFHRLDNRVGLWETVDSKSAQATALSGRVQDLALRRGELLRPLVMWFKGIEMDGIPTLDDENARRLFSAVDGMGFKLATIRQTASYALSLSEEDIVSHKDATGAIPLLDLREMIANDFRYELKLHGKTEKYSTDSELTQHIYSADPERRTAAVQALFVPYKANREKLFRIYQSIVKDWSYESKLRGYASPISMRNTANTVPDSAISVLMQVCEEERTIFQDYFRWKADKLGMKKLRRDDIYAPLKESKQKFTYEECIDIVLKSYDDFSPSFGEKARQIVESSHIHSHPSTVKRSGAFCAYVAPNVTPYILLNFSGRGRDISTIAHELGHGIHGLYTTHLPIGSAHANLPLAETASTFGEMLLFDALLEKITDPDEREALLSEKMADSYATICRQNYFVKFEIAAHEAIPNGASVDDLEQMWIDGLRDQFGDAVEVDDVFRNEWARIPHIVASPFYCYAYNFGELLSLSLYSKYKQEGKSFIPKIEKILAAGGSEDPQIVLQAVGVDMNSAEFWRGGFTLIREWMTQLKKTS